MAIIIEKLDSVADDFKKSCACGISFHRDNVHYFCDWLIRNDIMEPKLPGCYCCPAGRPVRAKELREHFFMKRFKRTFTPPAHNALVYSEKNDTGHVHYGGRDHAATGTHVERDEYFEYYF
ncbi:hypothetical protein AAVH_09384 [Aphelenchoides avenae]|nr:hypothetical protein AAVH_09384 [Aphelenchus avenae]